MFEKALTWILRKNHAFRRLADREVYPLGEVPQSTRPPYVTYQIVGEAGNTAHAGGAGSLRGDSVVLACWADDYSEAAELRDKLRAAILGQQGMFDGERIAGIFPAERRAEPAEAADRSEHVLQAAELGVTIWHYE